MEERKKLEELLEELVEEIKNAKTPEEVEVLQKKAKAVGKLVEAYEGDKDLDKIAVLMEKLGDMMEDIIQPLKELLNELYSPERVQAMGKSVAEFYRNLVEAGMDKEAALELTKEFMEEINPGKKIMEAIVGLTKKGTINVQTVHGPTYHGKKKTEEGEKRSDPLLSPLFSPRSLHRLPPG